MSRQKCGHRGRATPPAVSCFSAAFPANLNSLFRAVFHATNSSLSSTNTVAGGRTLIYRIPALVRTAHWVIALALLVLLLSGLQIFNAHPALYWGNGSPSGHSFFEIGARSNKRGEARGFVRLGSFQANTTGVLGVAKDS